MRRWVEAFLLAHMTFLGGEGEGRGQKEVCTCDTQYYGREGGYWVSLSLDIELTIRDVSH